MTRHIAFEEYLDLAPYCTRFVWVGHFRNCYYRWSFACLLDWYSKHSLDDAQKIAKRNRNKNDMIFSLVFAHGVVDMFVALSMSLYFCQAVTFACFMLVLFRPCCPDLTLLLNILKLKYVN